MKRKITWPDNGISAWKPDDKEFIKARKDEWTKVKHVLSLLKTFISKSLYSQHRELFMTGDIVKTYNPDKYLYGYSLSYNDVTLLFQLWYYPVNDLDYFRKLFDNADIVDINASRSSFNDYLYEPNRNDLDPEYGLMGGREESVFRTLYPSRDPEETKVVEHSPDLILGPDIRLVVKHIISAYSPRFRGKPVNVNAHGQHIWDYLEYQLDKYELDQLEIEPLLFKVLHIVKYREQSEPKFPVDKKDVVELADNLRKRFENREFTPGLMHIWDNIDDLYQDKYVNN